MDTGKGDQEKKIEEEDQGGEAPLLEKDQEDDCPYAEFSDITTCYGRY